jgi:purine-nucleoside phosphorylase
MDEIVTPYNFLRYFYSKEKIENFKNKFSGKTIFVIYSPYFFNFFHFLNEKYLLNEKDEINLNTKNDKKENKKKVKEKKLKLNINKKPKLICIENINKIYSINDEFFLASHKLGSAATLEILEILAFYGFKNIIQIGLAGTFSDEIEIGDIFISKGACSESITPYIYTKKKLNFDGINELFFLENNNDNLFYSDENLTIFFYNEILQNLSNLKSYKIEIFEGFHFSTDFIFKETKSKLQNLLKNNIEVVEMEGATFFGFCESKKIKSTAIYIISDKIDLNKNLWFQGWKDKKIENSFLFLFETILKIINKNIL